jgi:hypothetical protein
LDVSRLTCTKIDFANAIRETGITINPHYMNVVCEWGWVKPYLGDRFVTKNAIEVRNNTFNLLFNENFGDYELECIMDAILEVESKFVRD